MSRYDIIGDIHGHATELRELLNLLGYREKDGLYTHPTRKVIFLGDFIDRGPEQKEVLSIVRPMIDSGTAYAVMGNHEFNAICYATADGQGGYLRPHNDRNNQQHAAFLNAYPVGTAEYAEMIEWFTTLPLYIEKDGLHIVHACWESASLQKLQSFTDQANRLKDAAYREYADESSAVYQALETVLKGPEFTLSPDLHFKDKDGHVRDAARIKWWLDEKTPSHLKLDFVNASLNQKQRASLDRLKVGENLKIEKAPVFFGHYWMRGKPETYGDQYACVDYSVAKQGKLVAYSYDGDKKLNKRNFIYAANT